MQEMQDAGPSAAGSTLPWVEELLQIEEGEEEEALEKTPSAELESNVASGNPSSPPEEQMWCSGEAVTSWAAEGGTRKSKKPRAKPRRNRQRVNATQKRYRQRTKEQQQQKQDELKQMEEHTMELEQDNRNLARKHQLLTELVRVQEIHLCRLSNHKEVKELETRILLQELASLVSSACGVQVTSEDAQQWTMAHWLHNLFPRYLAMLAGLLQEASGASLAAAGSRLQLDHLVRSRRNAAARRGLFAHLHASLFMWNMAYTRTLPSVVQPNEQLWAAVLDGLQLTADQQAGVLGVRGDVLMWFEQANMLCGEAYAAVSQDLAWLTMDNTELSEGMHMLRSALELEFRAAAHFHWMLTQEILTPQQEAWLDAGPVLRPWCANLWAISDVLAARTGLSAAPNFDNLRQRPHFVQRYTPSMAGFQLLVTDCTALGAGTQLKRGILCSWYLYLSSPRTGAFSAVRPAEEASAFARELETWTLESLQSTPLADLWV